MSKIEPKLARRAPEMDDLTVQFSVPPELLQQLSDRDDEKTRVGPLPGLFEEEQTRLMLSPLLAEASETVLPPLAPTLRPMTPVTITEAELRALLRPQRLARLAGLSLALAAALVVGAVAMAAR